MLDTFLSGAYAPFTFAITLLFGLLALEIMALILGGTLMGDGAETDMDIDMDLGVGDLGDMPEVDLGDLDLDPAEFEIASAEDVAVETPTAGPSPLAWLGLGRMPTLLWLATLCLGFGVGGLILQNLATALLGQPLPALVAVIPMAGAAIWFTGRFGALFARLLPRTETQSVAERQLARRRGTVTQGTAARGRPAEVRVTDRYGNLHYLRAEPLRDDVEIAQGTDVLVLRHRPTDTFRLVPLT